jgi:hypothetical protein
MRLEFMPVTAFPVTAPQQTQKWQLGERQIHPFRHANFGNFRRL